MSPDTRLGATAILALCGLVVGCQGGAPASPEGSANRAHLHIVATTEILADLVQNVGGDRVSAESLVPHGADPHSYEPSPSDAERVARADVTFTNHLLLEEHALIKTIDANARPGTLSVSLAEASESYGANVIPLVEDIGLDVIWLGLRVRGDGHERGASRSSDVLLSATGLDGPGDLTVYLTEALGQPRIYWASADGFDATDTTTLPPAAHTHLNWAFTEPGVYHLRMKAQLRNPGGTPVDLGTSTFTFAVGVEPHAIDPGATVLDDGHTDITVDLDTGDLYLWTDIGDAGRQSAVAADEGVIDVPNRALETVPDDPRFAFLGAPGSRVFQLPQAVLGKHVHGEIDPHLWQDVQNARAYVQLIRDTLVEADPDGADVYAANARAYLDELEELDGYVRDRLATIPPDRRQLITTHDAFGYLASAYGMHVAGFVVPNPAQEPSVEQVLRLTETIRNLGVPAVFMEPYLEARVSVLRQIAKDHGVQVCKLYGDGFDQDAPDYVTMMRHNADELVRCLGAA